MCSSHIQQIRVILPSVKWGRLSANSTSPRLLLNADSARQRSPDIRGYTGQSPSAGSRCHQAHQRREPLPRLHSGVPDPAQPTLGQR